MFEWPTENRGVSSVLGFVLLVGLIVAGISVTAYVGSDALSQLQQSTETEQAKVALSQLDAKAATVALGGSERQSVKLGAARSGTLRTEASGRMVVENQSGNEYLNQTLGTVVYEQEGGDVVAYQGGGVWQASGDYSSMVSPPEFHYRDGTLTLPLVVVNPTNRGTTGDGRVSLSQNGSRLSVASAPVEGEVINISVTSEYYLAWGQFFRERIEGVTVSYDHDAETAEIQLAEHDIDGDYGTGVVAQGDVTIGNGNPEVESTIRAGGEVTGANGNGGNGGNGGHSNTLTCDEGTGDECTTEGANLQETPLDYAIETLVNGSEANDPSANVDGGSRTLTAGSYYSDGFLLDDGTLTFDLSSGNVTLYVDGNIGVDNQQVEVVNGAGTHHYAKIFTTGDFAMRGGGAGVTVESGNATRFQLFGTSEMHFGIGQSNGGGYTGTVYAPRYQPATGSNDAVTEYGLNSVSCADEDMCLGTGSGSFRGAIVGGPLSVQQNADFTYADEIELVNPSLPDGTILPPPITYLHISVNRIDVAGVSGRGSVTLPAALTRFRHHQPLPVEAAEPPPVRGRDDSLR